MVADRVGNAGIESGTGQSQIIIGKPGKSCTETCQEVPTMLKCNIDEIRNLNKCKDISHFLCRRGCSRIYGREWYIPRATWKTPLKPRLQGARFPGLASSSTYFNGKQKSIEGVCLVYPGPNDDITCGGKHPGIRRICACG